MEGVLWGYGGIRAGGYSSFFGMFLAFGLLKIFSMALDFSGGARASKISSCRKKITIMRSEK